MSEKRQEKVGWQQQQMMRDDEIQKGANCGPTANERKQPLF